jgi:lysophospholipase L1-like esterase
MTLSFTKKIIVGFVILITGFISCKKDGPLFVTNPASINGKNKTAFFAKILANEPVKIACEGTSLTYGENNPGVEPPINGAVQDRALYQYPSSLQAALKSYGINANIINRGFPGDRTADGIARWKDSTVADIVIVEYGTNDCFNYAGYSSGTLSVPAFTDSLSKIVQRRLDEGAWVVICSPPNLRSGGSELNAYKNAITNVANIFSLPVFDVQKSVIKGSADYSDQVHLTAAAYQRWGDVLAPHLEKQ